MTRFHKATFALAAATLLLGAAGPAAPAPSLDYAFTAIVNVAPAVEQGPIDGGRKRFIAITGGSVQGPMLSGTVLPGGGDWQTILPGGLTKVEAHYFLKAADGTIIEVSNPGVRTGSTDVIERLAKGEDVDPSAYYFRTTPHFEVEGGRYDWLRRNAFVARGVRRPSHVEIDFYVVR